MDHQLKQDGLTSDEKKRIEAERIELLKKREGFGQEFRGVTRIVRTGDSGPHFHSRFTMEFESTAHEKYGCVWETHTLCKHHAYNLCDAHGGSIKRFVKAHSVQTQRAFSAEDYCRIINGSTDQVFANATAYAFKNIDRSDKQTLPEMLRDMNGMRACCEFQYTSKNESGEFVPTSHVVRMRMCSGSEEPYKTFLLKKQPHKGRYCNKCTLFHQRPTFHPNTVSDCPNWHFATPVDLFRASLPPEISKPPVIPKGLQKKLKECNKRPKKANKKRTKPSSSSSFRVIFSQKIVESSCDSDTESPHKKYKTDDHMATISDASPRRSKRLSARPSQGSSFEPSSDGEHLHSESDGSSFEPTSDGEHLSSEGVSSVSDGEEDSDVVKGNVSRKNLATV